MNKLRAFILISSLVLNIGECVAQEYWELETVVPPEVSHFKIGLKSDVAATGALNISIPLLTVPGRGGFDFPISLGYTAGIKTRQQSSWVGLGWSLDLGNITRVVRLLPDYDSVRTEKLNHDYPDYYLVSLPNFSSVMNQMDTIRTNPPRFVLENTNAWKVDVRYKTFGGFRWPYNNDFTDNYDSAYYYGGGNWKYGTQMVFDNNPYNGTTSGKRDTSYRDIDKFILTSSDGTRYVFGLALRSEDRMGGIVMEHISNWRLTAILSPDFIDGGGDDLNPMDVNELSCKGSWIYVKYRSIENMRLRKYENPNLLMQVTYPDTIYTPTHKVIFTTSTRYDIGFAIPEPYIGAGFPYNAYGMDVLPRKLDKIVLIERTGNKTIKRFDFIFAPKVNQLAHAYEVRVIQGVQCDSLGKLTLKMIVPYDTSSMPDNAYQFEYHKFNPFYYDSHFYQAGSDPVDLTAGFPISGILSTPGDSYSRRRTDLFGYFYGRRSELSYYCSQYQLGSDSNEVINTDGAVAYSLKKIIYPTGGFEYYEYEKNQFDATDKDTSKWGSGAVDIVGNSGNGLRPNGECGIRIKKKTVSKGDATSHTIEYQYGTGHLSAPSVNAYRYSSNIFRVMDWGKSAVEYEWIQEKYADSSKVKRTYYFPNTYFYNPQLKFASNNIYTYYSYQPDILVVEKSHDWKRSYLKKTEYLNSNNQRTQCIDNVYSFLVKDSMKTFYKEKTTNKIYYTTMYCGIVLKNTQIDTMYDQSGSNPISKASSYVYTLKGFPRVATDFNSDGRMRKFVTDYMLADSVSYSGVALDMFNKNMYSAIKAKRLYEDDTLKNYTEYNYKVFDPIWLKRIYIDKKYQWRDANSNNIVDSGELLTTATVDSLDNFGNPLIVTDPNGVKNYFTWYQNSKLASKTKFNQKVSYTYNQFHQVRSIIDENNNETRYVYDNFWRLRQIISPDGKILREYQYNYKQ
ncbi:hypothetical protein JNM05_07790 [bacterium]|nr:hypothetical protein [bacterium]